MMSPSLRSLKFSMPIAALEALVDFLHVGP